MAYSISATGYLSRARALIESGRPDALFHAALELRCCVETRQADYAKALQAYKGTKIRAWKIQETGRRIEKASHTKSIARMAYSFNGFSIVSFHTPVTKDLVTFAESLGALLHAQTIYRDTDDDWWATLRDRLIEGYRKAWLACQGDSMVPPLWNSKTRGVHPMVIERTDADSALFAKALEPGTEFVVDIRYLEAPPDDWVCDLQV